MTPDQRAAQKANEPSPWTPAERQALADIEARQQAEQERRMHRAIQEQQQRLQSTGDIQ